MVDSILTPFYSARHVVNRTSNARETTGDEREVSIAERKRLTVLSDGEGLRCKEEGTGAVSTSFSCSLFVWVRRTLREWMYATSDK